MSLVSSIYRSAGTSRPIDRQASKGSTAYNPKAPKRKKPKRKRAKRQCWF